MISPAPTCHSTSNESDSSGASPPSPRWPLPGPPACSLNTKAPPRPTPSSSLPPYRHAGTWVFDDPAAHLVREPFVAGVPEMIDVLVRDIPGATNGFRMIFSAKPFPGYQKKLAWLRGDMGGNYYKMDQPPLEGWICPALFRYYQTAPKELYVKAEPKK